MSLVILSMGALGVGGDPTAPPQAPPAPALPPPPIVTPPSPCPTITITPGTVPNGTAGVPYRQSFVASGGTGPYTFTSTGVIPPGLTLASTGVLSGTPTVPATLTVAIIATDANGCFGNVVGPILISPAPPPPCPTIVVGPTSLPLGTVGTPYSQALTATGGAAPYTFTAGPLPAGVTLSPSGALSGTPTVATSIYVTLTATDTHGCPGTLVIPMTIQPTPPPIVPTPPPSQPPGSQRILGAADIAYVGCFRLPTAVSTAFAYGNLTGRVVNGQTHLFVYGENPVLHDPIYEVIDPGSGYTTDYHTAPRATLYANWGSAVYGASRTSFNPATGAPRPPAFLIPGGLYWNEATQLLYWTYYDSYNVSGFPDWGLGASQLINPATAQSFAYGPWRTKATDADGKLRYGPWRCLYVWASPLDGSFLCGSSIQSGASESPWGPDMYGMAAWPTPTTPPGPSIANDLILTTRSLEHYYMGDNNAANYITHPGGAVVGHLRSFRRRLNQALFEHQGLQADPAQNGGVGSFGQLDRTHGAIWLQLTNVRGVIFSNTLAGAVSQVTTDPLAGHCWYSNAGLNPPVGACFHGIPPPVMVTGPVSTASFPAWAIYNPDDLAAVANTANDYTPEPTSVINMEATFGVQTAHITNIGAAKTLEGFYFDPVRKYLFAVSHGVDDTQGPYAVESIIHVFAVNDVP